MFAGSLVEEFPGEELFDVGQKSTNVRNRVKRSTCRLPDFTLTNCIERKVTCKGGCDQKDAKYDCKSPVWNCQYTLVCRPDSNVSSSNESIKSKPWHYSMHYLIRHYYLLVDVKNEVVDFLSPLGRWEMSTAHHRW